MGHLDYWNGDYREVTSKKPNTVTSEAGDQLLATVLELFRNIKYTYITMRCLMT